MCTAAVAVVVDGAVVVVAVVPLGSSGAGCAQGTKYPTTLGSTSDAAAGYAAPGDAAAGDAAAGDAVAAEAAAAEAAAAETAAAEAAAAVVGILSRDIVLHSQHWQMCPVLCCSLDAANRQTYHIYITNVIWCAMWMR